VLSGVDGVIEVQLGFALVRGDDSDWIETRHGRRAPLVYDRILADLTAAWALGKHR
jgi:hypothetical protein